jgi:hypothetical protein
MHEYLGVTEFVFARYRQQDYVDKHKLKLYTGLVDPETKALRKKNQKENVKVRLTKQLLTDQIN